MGTRGGSVSIFKGILLILGCLLGGPGAPLGPIFRPPGPPEPHRRHKNSKKVLPSAQCGARWNSRWIRSSPEPCKCKKNTIKTTCFARVHYRQFSPKRSPRRLPKQSFWRPVEHPGPFLNQLWRPEVALERPLSPSAKNIEFYDFLGPGRGGGYSTGPRSRPCVY